MQEEANKFLKEVDTEQIGINVNSNVNSMETEE